MKIIRKDWKYRDVKAAAERFAANSGERQAIWHDGCSYHVLPTDEAAPSGWAIIQKVGA